MLPVLQPVGRTLVFVATRADCETLASDIAATTNIKGVLTLHGDKHATDRQSALRQFKSNNNDHNNNILIATDVAARGLDIAVATVICFDPAKTLDIHVHRIGRAGRMDGQGGYREGTAYTLLLNNRKKNDADFAHILMNSFERDGREISAELRQLALQSRRSGNVDRRDKWNKGGLGFEEASSSGASSTTQSNQTASRGGGDYYGPSSSSSLLPQMPPAKKSRWG